MEMVLENLSSSELFKLAKNKLAAERAYPEIDRLSLERDCLKAQVEMFQRVHYGQNLERFEGDPNHTMLPF